jgi:hypothetical protein
VRIPHADVKWTRRADWPKKRDNLKDWVKNAAALVSYPGLPWKPLTDVQDVRDGQVQGVPGRGRQVHVDAKGLPRDVDSTGRVGRGSACSIP